MTQIMRATVPRVTSSSGLRKFQADGFLFDRVYIKVSSHVTVSNNHMATAFLSNQPCKSVFDIQCFSNQWSVSICGCYKTWPHAMYIPKVCCWRWVSCNWYRLLRKEWVEPGRQKSHSILLNHMYFGYEKRHYFITSIPDDWKQQSLKHWTGTPYSHGWPPKKTSKQQQLCWL